jgi:NAD(P)-dependent dehydrogenase (short-subunit alcohol dehydrogenase family)
MSYIYQKIFNLENKNIIITGANGFLGSYFSKLLSKCGSNLYLVDKKLNKIKKELKKYNKAYFDKVDITSKKNCKKIIDNSIKKLKKIDILINCAAINASLSKQKITFEKYPEKFWKSSLDTNLNSAFYLSQYIGNHYLKNGKGKIIFIGSHYSVVAPDQTLYLDKKGKQSFIKSPDYIVSKFGLVGLTKYLASYYSGKNITVNMLSPTSIKNNEKLEFIKNFSKKTPARRMSKLDEYSGPILFLCSDSSSYVNGFNLLVDGGLTST